MSAQTINIEQIVDNAKKKILEEYKARKMTKSEQVAFNIMMDAGSDLMRKTHIDISFKTYQQIAMLSNSQISLQKDIKILNGSFKEFLKDQSDINRSFKEVVSLIKAVKSMSYIFVTLLTLILGGFGWLVSFIIQSSGH